MTRRPSDILVTREARTHFVQSAADLDTKADVFVHVSAVERAGIEQSAPRQNFELDLEPDAEGQHDAGSLRLL